MKLVFGDYVMVDVENKRAVVNDIVISGYSDGFSHEHIDRAMAVHRSDCVGFVDIPVGYFLTCDFLGIRSFHGFKFVKGDLMIQFQMARKYIDMENLKFSSYRNKGSGAVLKRLGFKDVATINGVTVAQRP